MEKSDFKEFEHIDIFKTGLIDSYARNKKFLAQNGIYSLADLFRKSDEGSIKFSDVFTMTNKDVEVLIALARSKYLNEDLSFGVDPFEKHDKSYWFYSASEREKLNLTYASIGELLGSNVKKEVTKKINYLGFDIETVLVLAEKINLGECFSLADIFTNDVFIEVVRRRPIPEIKKNCILAVSEYFKRNMAKDQKSEDENSIEKRLLKRLIELEREKQAILKKIEEIHKEKSGNQIPFRPLDSK